MTRPVELAAAIALVAPALAQAASPSGLALDVAAAAIRTDEYTAEAVLDLTLDDASRAAFARLTTDNVGKTLSIAIDERIVIRPVIQGPIEGGRLSITGGGAQQGLSRGDLEAIAARLQAGGRIMVTIAAPEAEASPAPAPTVPA